MTTRFDWEALWRRYRVPYVTSGPNTKAGEINIKCPRCGVADPSEHLGISLEGRGWRCLKCDFGGKSRAVLIRAVLKCSDADARLLAGYEDALKTSSEDDLRVLLGRMDETDRAAEQRPPLTMPRSFRPLLCGHPAGDQFVRYVASRGYGPIELEWIAREYDLRWTTVGQFAYRLIFPVRDRRGALVTWVGRTILKNSDVRYLSLTARLDRACDGPVASVSVKSSLLGLPSLWEARDTRALVVCEGPMDAVRLSLYGRSLGVYATCLFGLTASDAQVEELEGLATRFPRIWLCLDAGEEIRSQALLRSLAATRARPLHLVGVKDPGDLSPSQAVELCALSAA